MARTLVLAALVASLVALPVWYFSKTSPIGSAKLPKNPPPAGTLVDERCLHPGLGQRCVRLYTPQNHSDRNSPVISIAALILSPLDVEATNAPFLYLEGGPGYAGLVDNEELYGKAGYYREIYARILDAGRDVILVDTRGLGRAEPSLQCPTAERAAWDDLKRMPEQRRLNEPLTQYKECFAAFREAGIDLTQYNSDAVARDLALLRRGFGIDQWTIYGVSYGARTALSVLEVDRAGVQSAIFDSPSYDRLDVYSADQASFDRVFEMASADKCTSQKDICTEKFKIRVEALLMDLESDPIVIRKNPFGKPVLIGGRDAIYLIHDALYKEDGFSAVAQMIPMMEAQGRGYLASLSNDSIAWWESLYWGYLDTAYSVPVGYATSCAEMDFLSPPPKARFPIYTQIEYAYQRDLCEAIGVVPATRAMTAERFKGVPSLILSGERDVITPPAYGEKLAADIGGTWLLHKSAAHGVAFWNGDCVSDVVDQILAQTEKPVLTKADCPVEVKEYSSLYGK